MTDQERKELLAGPWGWRYTVDKETGMCTKVKEPSLVNRFPMFSTWEDGKEVVRFSPATGKRWMAYLVNELGPEGMKGLYFNGSGYSMDKEATDAHE